MNILVFNCGSSSLTYKVFEVERPDTVTVIVSGKAHRVGVKGSEPAFIESLFNGEVHKETMTIKNHADAGASIITYVQSNNIPVDCIGHRFVHGGMHFQKSVFLSKDTLEKLYECLPLAPIHNPNSLRVIREATKHFPEIPQYVTFDTAFHSTIPSYAYTYALPEEILKKYGFRKYGFHGLSYVYVIIEAAHFLKTPLEELRIVACHLGTGGASVAAIKNGCSIDTSMGFSPLPGLIMSTRAGDIDPLLTIYLMAVFGYRPDELLTILNKESGLLGISGFSSDIRDILNRATEEQADLAVAMYIHRLKKYIGSYIAALGGIDVLLFTDDIGLHNWKVREKVCENMQWCGLSLDKDLNRHAAQDRISLLNKKDSSVQVLCTPTEEELVICREGITLLEEQHDTYF